MVKHSSEDVRVMCREGGLQIDFTLIEKKLYASEYNGETKLVRKTLYTNVCRLVENYKW
jgi:hypothetical protein